MIIELKCKKAVRIFSMMNAEELYKKARDIAYEPDYKITIQLLQIISVLGWIIAIMGLLSFLWFFLLGGLTLLVLPVTVLVFLAGLLLVISGQVAIAIINNTNYSKQILTELQKNE